jgi:CheY-like chemotaxis protein
LLSDGKKKIFYKWNGEEALDDVEKRTDISLVLIAIKMPIIEEYEAMRLIK